MEREAQQNAVGAVMKDARTEAKRSVRLGMFGRGMPRSEGADPWGEFQPATGAGAVRGADASAGRSVGGICQVSPAITVMLADISIALGAAWTAATIVLLVIGYYVLNEPSQ